MSPLFRIMIGLAAAALAAAPGQATQFVINGGFETTALPARNTDLGGSTTLYDGKSSIQMSSNSGTQYVAGWNNCAMGSGDIKVGSNAMAAACGYSAQGTGTGTAAGYSMLMINATTTNTIYTNDNNTIALWGQPSSTNSDGTARTTTDTSATGAFKALSLSGNGGNFLAADGAYGQAYIYQVLNNLTINNYYDLTFYYAGAQQYTFTGATTEQWIVNFTNTSNSGVVLDNQRYYTPVLNDASHSFTGWKTASTTFKATDTSMVLSFLAAGTPDGKPPFSLLDGVSFTEHSPSATSVPEPASWALMIVGFGFVGRSMRGRRLRPAAA